MTSKLALINLLQSFSCLQKYFILWMQHNLFNLSLLDLDLAVFLRVEICLILSYHLEKSQHANFLHSCKVQTHYLS